MVIGRPGWGMDTNVRVLYPVSCTVHRTDIFTNMPTLVLISRRNFDSFTWNCSYKLHLYYGTTKLWKCLDDTLTVTVLRDPYYRAARQHISWLLLRTIEICGIHSARDDISLSLWNKTDNSLHGCPYETAPVRWLLFLITFDWSYGCNICPTRGKRNSLLWNCVHSWYQIICFFGPPHHCPQMLYSFVHNCDNNFWSVIGSENIDTLNAGSWFMHALGPPTDHWRNLSEWESTRTSFDRLNQSITWRQQKWRDNEDQRTTAVPKKQIEMSK